MSSPPPGLTMIKGHGTENDFLLIEDLADTLDLGSDFIRALCDRRAGIGADGVLRVVRHAAAELDEAEFFMDYRNSDGSTAEMCGNGLRVFLRFLIRQGLVDQGPAGTGPVRVATRGGVRTAWTGSDDQITVDLGAPGFPDGRPRVTAAGWSQDRPGVAVGMPNPHVVVEVTDADELAGLDLTTPPQVEPVRAGGQNVEFIHLIGAGHLSMRVHERGSGETRSCGTGIAAAALVAMRRIGGDPGRWRVDVPGGTCVVRIADDGGVLLTGPAVLVANVDLAPEWLAALSARRG